MIQTIWLCILTSGNTVDGREVPPETLEEVAATYNPETYNARINNDHSKFSTKLGSVLELKTEDHGDKKQLFAKLKPNSYYLYMIENGQKLHFSAEITPNFADTGKSYLTGLAATDDPASIGTTEIKLSADGKGSNFYSSNEIAEFDEPKKSSLFSKVFKQEDEQMPNKALLELMQQMNETQTQLLTAVADLGEKFTASPTQDGDEKPKDGEDSEQPKDSVEPDQSVTKLTEQVESLSSQVTELTSKLSAMNDDVDRDPATGADGDDTEEYL